jgi:uncharacterized protein (TIGR03435 family)
MEFDAASVKPAGPFTPGHGGFGISGGPGSNDPGRVTMPRIALSTLIRSAYDLWPDQVQGPAWMTNMMENGFTISATMPAATTKEQYCGMLRNLLATRFHLTFRRETQARPGYELTVMPGGPKFKEYVPGQSSPESAAGMRSDANGFPVMPPEQPAVLSFSVNANGLRKQSFRNNMALFARSVGAAISQSTGGDVVNAPQPRVIDKTGLTGIYDIRLEYQGAPLNMPAAAGPPQDGAAVAQTPDSGPNIFNALQQQLGLKLQKIRDVPVEVLIVDHVDQTPTDN